MALIVENVREKELRTLPLYGEGKICLQRLSSMILPLVLEPGAGESILERVLPAAGARVVPIPEDTFPGAPRLPVRLPGALCICPAGLVE